MKNIRTWIHNYQNLSFEQQCEVAKAIVEALSKNQYHFMENDKDMDEVVSFFRRILESANQKNVIGENKSVLERFEGLSQVNKEKTIKKIIDVINSCDKAQKQEENERTCLHEGHIFGDWNYHEWTTKEVCWDAGPQGYVDVKHEKWTRVCSRCGFVEEVKDEPQELIEKRNEINRKARIKRLETELKRLKGDN